MIFNKNTKVEHILENEQAAAVLESRIPALYQVANSNSRAAQLSVENLIRYTKIPNADSIVAALDTALSVLNTPENAVSPSEAKQIRRFLEIWEQEKTAHTASLHHQDAIYPGQPWLDTKGERIQAHGGAVFWENGIYYWYGENKTYTDGVNGIWTWGIKVYASADLCNWEDRGYLIEPVLDDPNSALFPTKRVDRPHILKCPKTGKYVCWIKLSGPEAAFTIWQADSLLGKYEMVENLYQPGGHLAGDFDLVSDKETGTGYLYFDAEHKAMLCMELTEDYLHASKEIVRNYPDMTPPFTREAPCLFESNGKKYMITSGMTGYVPNQSDSAVSNRWDGEFISLGEPHVDDPSRASFNSQISKVFLVEGKENLYIAMADRWLPKLHVDAHLADIFVRVIGSRSDSERYQATDAERQEMYAANILEDADTVNADYVWLPIRFEGEKIKIDWLDKWTPEDYM